MDTEVKQRNRRRKRAQRMQAIHDKANADTGDEDDIKGKPLHRPPIRRKKVKEPLVEEDIIDGFAILGFKTYEDLEVRLKKPPVRLTGRSAFVPCVWRCSFVPASVKSSTVSVGFVLFGFCVPVGRRLAIVVA